MLEIKVREHTAQIVSVVARYDDGIIRHDDSIAIRLEFPEPIEGRGGFYVFIDPTILSQDPLDKDMLLQVISSKAEEYLAKMLHDIKESNRLSGRLAERRQALAKLEVKIAQILEV